MSKVLVPADLAGSLAADGRLGDLDVETVDDFATALTRLDEGSAQAVFLGDGQTPLDRATYKAIVNSFSGLEQPVLVLSSNVRLLWANAAAEAKGITLDDPAAADAASFFEPAGRHSFLETLAGCIRDRVVQRVIVVLSGITYEVHVIPTGPQNHSLVAAVFNEKKSGIALFKRMERLAQLGTNLFPEDVEALVRLPAGERIDLIKGLIEKTVKETFRYDDFILRTLNQETSDLEAILVRSTTGASLSKRALHVDAERGSVAGHVAATAIPYLVQDASAEPLWISDLEGIQSAVVVPLKLGNKVVGTFAIENKEKFAYDYYDLILAKIFAGYITAALDMADIIGLGQSVLVDRVAESVAEEVSGHLKNIHESLEELRRQNIGDSIAVTSRLASIRASAATIEDAIMKGARKVGAAVAPPAAAPEAVLDGKCILVADDEAGILQSLGDILRSAGCEVAFACDGSEAVEMATKQYFDLVISDIKMPKMTGYEVYSSIKARFPDTSVILMTAYGYDPTHSIVRAKQEGLEAVLYKPFRAETLKKALTKALQKKEAKK